MADYECSRCDYTASVPESVAGHLLSVHNVNAFSDLDEVEQEDLHDRVLDALKSL